MSQRALSAQRAYSANCWRDIPECTIRRMLTIETEKTQQALLDKGIEGVPAQAQHVGSPYLQHPALVAQGDLTQPDPGAPGCTRPSAGHGNLRL